MEMPSIGGKFTWTSNSTGVGFKQTRLDRAFTNQAWIDFWPDARLEFFNGTNDYKGMIVTFSQVEKSNKPFRLFNNWLEDPEYMALARTGLSTQVQGTGLYKIQKKLKEVKTLTKQWLANKEGFQRQLSSAKKDLEEALKNLDASPTSPSLQAASNEKKKKPKKAIGKRRIGYETKK